MYGGEDGVFEAVEGMGVVDLGGNSAATGHSRSPLAVVTGSYQADYTCTSCGKLM